MDSNNLLLFGTGGYLTAILLVIFVALLLRWLNNPFRNIPGPPGLPLLGNTLDFVKCDDVVGLRLKWAKEHGALYKDSIFLESPKIIVSGAEYAKYICVTNNANFVSPKEFVLKLIPALGNSLPTTNGAENARQRKYLSPAFSLESVKDYLDIFNQKAKELNEFLSEQISRDDGETYVNDLVMKFNHVTLDVIGLCAFDYSFDCTLNGFQEESRAVEAAVSGSLNIHRKLIESKLPFLRYFPSNEKEKAKLTENSCNDLIQRVIQKRREEIEHGVAGNKTDLLQKLMLLHGDGQEKLSNKDLFHQIYNFLFAGHKTTSTALTWTTYLLAKHPEIQSRVRDEIKEVIGDKSEISYEDLSKLKTLDNCIKESMRLYPPAPLVGRKCVKEDQIGPYNIPANTYVFIDFISLFRSEKYWENANEYNPDRFDDKVGPGGKDPFYFMPFGRGPRLCIGFRFAEIQIRVILASLLKTFSLKLAENCPDVKTKSFITLMPDPNPILEVRFNGKTE